MIRNHHLIRGTIALAAALTASLAPAAWADPAPLAKAEATIAATSQSSTAVRPNPDEQTATGATANPGPCSEVCSGGAASYGSATHPSSAHNQPVAALRSGPGIRTYAAAFTPPSAVRVATHSTGFDWGDAGIGAGGMLALTLIALGGALTATRRRNHRISGGYAVNTASAASTQANQG